MLQITRYSRHRAPNLLIDLVSCITIIGKRRRRRARLAQSVEHQTFKSTVPCNLRVKGSSPLSGVNILEFVIDT